MQKTGRLITFTDARLNRIN